MSGLAKTLAALLGPKGRDPADEAAPRQRDWLGRYGEPPLARASGFFLLAVVASASLRMPRDEILGDVLERGMAEGLVIDGTIATSEARRAAFWRLREEQPAGQRREGPQLKHDISVPPGQIAAFVAEGAALCSGVLSEVRINPFGHLGDGNIHYNRSSPAGAEFDGKAEAMALGLARLADVMGGSFVADLGPSRAKVEFCGCTSSSGRTANDGGTEADARCGPGTEPGRGGAAGLTTNTFHFAGILVSGEHWFGAECLGQQRCG